MALRKNPRIRERELMDPIDSGSGLDSGSGEVPELPETSRMSLSALRETLSNLDSEAEINSWCEALSRDQRVGAREIGERMLRRLRAEQVESERLERLFEHRARLIEGGCQVVAGVDEVGVGPLAGPVVAAAVVLPARVDLPGLNDSKKLSSKARERLDRAIREQALGFAIGEVESVEIDRINILQATLESMRRAVNALESQLQLDHVLVDARKIPGVSIAQTALIHGDAIDGSIAAASIVAKVYRDGLMKRFAVEYPGYGLERHMGYGTSEHIDALDRLGVSPIHRRSFSPVAAAAKKRV